jgi:hypothetical protein
MALLTQDQLLKQTLALLGVKKDELIAEPAAAPVVEPPVWETPAHEEIPLHELDTVELGLDPFASEDDAKLADAIIEAKREKADPLPFVPALFKQTRNWVRWKLENVDGRDTKVPYQVNGSKASSTEAATWTDYQTAVTGQSRDKTQGVGFVLAKKLGIVGFDLDGSLNPQTGDLAPWAKRIIDALASYTEITPSGTGVRVFVRGEKPDGKYKFHLALSAGVGDKVQIEVYDDKRYFTMTGNRLNDATEVVERNVAEAYKLCYEIMREHPTEKVTRDTTSTFDDSPSVQVKRSGTAITTKLALLMHGEIVSRSPFTLSDASGNSIEYPSQSEADMALATLLAMRHGDDPAKIEDDIRESALYRQKWERDDYRTGTIERAVRLARKLAEKATTQPTTENVANGDDEPEEKFEDKKQEVFPESPIFPGALTDLARALYPSLPLEFKMWGLITRWGLMRSGIDTLKTEKHIQPRFYTALICYPNRGKTAANNESRTAAEFIFEMAKTAVEEEHNRRPVTRIFGGYEARDSVDSGPFLVDKFYDLVREAGEQVQSGTSKDSAGRLILDPDELSEMFEKARSSNTRISTIFHQLLKLHSGNRTGSGTKATGDKPVEKAHLAILGGTTVDVYKEHLWTGTGSGRDGLRSRFLAITTNAPPVPPVPLPTDTDAAMKAYQRLAKLLRMPGQEITFNEDAAKMLNDWWYSFDNGKVSATRILETVKQLLIVLAVVNAPENHEDTTLTVGADLMHHAIAFGEYEIAVREQLNPDDSWSHIQAMENSIIAWAKKHMKRTDPKTRNECRRGIQPQRMPGGLGGFKIAWDNCVTTGVLKLRDKGHKAGRYSL